MFRIDCRRFFQAALLAASFSWPAPARDLSWAVEALRPVLEEFSASHGQVGLSVAVAHSEGIAWSASYGMADRERKLPVTASTIFELGSISKVFTCLAVMQLREQGKVDLDRPYVAYVPEFRVKSPFPAGGEAITVRMLMTHTSGLVTDDDAWETTHPARDFHRAVLEHVKETQLLFPPGRQWNYSSFGTSLLGVLIERVSGQDFQEYMKRNVLLPLDMPSASFDARQQDPARISAGYHYNPGYDLIPKDEIRPGGSLRAPIEEASHLLTLMARRGATQTQRLLSGESVDEMLRLQNPGDPAHPMGLGFQIHTGEGGNALPVTFVYHHGIARNRGLFMFVPTWSVGFIVALNDLEKSDLFLWELEEAFLKAGPKP